MSFLNFFRPENCAKLNSYIHSKRVETFKTAVQATHSFKMYENTILAWENEVFYILTVLEYLESSIGS